MKHPISIVFRSSRKRKRQLIKKEGNKKKNNNNNNGLGAYNKQISDLPFQTSGFSSFLSTLEKVASKICNADNPRSSGACQYPSPN
jgi:hypothetical protein